MGNFKWLDNQKPNSIVFVGFGIAYEIAYGLKLSELSFLWVLMLFFCKICKSTSHIGCGVDLLPLFLL